LVASSATKSPPPNPHMNEWPLPRNGQQQRPYSRPLLSFYSPFSSALAGGHCPHRPTGSSRRKFPWAK
jgi:hypothetical protein